MIRNTTYRKILLPEKVEIRSLDELHNLLNVAIELEEYEVCADIKYVIDNYDELISQL